MPLIATCTVHEGTIAEIKAALASEQVALGDCTNRGPLVARLERFRSLSSADINEQLKQYTDKIPDSKAKRFNKLLEYERNSLAADNRATGELETEYAKTVEDILIRALQSKHLACDDLSDRAALASRLQRFNSLTKSRLKAIIKTKCPQWSPGKQRKHEVFTKLLELEQGQRSSLSPEIGATSPLPPENGATSPLSPVTPPRAVPLEGEPRGARDECNTHVHLEHGMQDSAQSDLTEHTVQDQVSGEDARTDLSMPDNQDGKSIQPERDLMPLRYIEPQGLEERWSKSELRDFLKHHCQPYSGNCAELLARVLAFRARRASPEFSDASPTVFQAQVPGPFQDNNALPRPHEASVQLPIVSRFNMGDGIRFRDLDFMKPLADFMIPREKLSHKLMIFGVFSDWIRVEPSGATSPAVTIPTERGVYEWAAQIVKHPDPDHPKELFAFYLGKAERENGLRGRFKDYVGPGNKYVIPKGNADTEGAKKQLFKDFQDAKLNGRHFPIFYRFCRCVTRANTSGCADSIERYYLSNIDYAANTQHQFSPGNPAKAGPGPRPANELRLLPNTTSQFLSDLL